MAKKGNSVVRARRKQMKKAKRSQVRLRRKGKKRKK